jgi:hypothetical protein
MHSTAVIQASPAGGVFLTPLSETGRYQISACVGLKEVITYTDDLEAAEVAFDVCFVQPFKDDRDAHGGIYDMKARRYVRTWRGGPRYVPQPHPMIALFDKAVRNGHPVRIITAEAIVEINIAAGEGA